MTRPAKRAGLFHGYWFELGGKRIERVKRADLRTAYYLWAKHKDIRTGKPRPT